MLEIELKKNKTGISAVEMLVVGIFSCSGCVVDVWLLVCVVVFGCLVDARVMLVCGSGCDKRFLLAGKFFVCRHEIEF